MNLIKNFLFQYSKTKKIFILIFFIILLLVVVKLVQLGIFCITDPTTPFLKTMLSIQETPSNLEKSKKIVIQKNRCKVAVYPTEHLQEEFYVREKNPNWIAFALNSSDYQLGLINVQILNTSITDEDMLKALNQKSKIVDSKKINFFNYYMYNNRDYVFTISREMVTFTSIINNNYTYWVQINGKYKNFTKEDIESVLYFEIL